MPHVAHASSNQVEPWFHQYRLSRVFWLFFSAALFYDAGFGLYFFLFNLYLLDFHLDERAIGIINGALSLGLMFGTLPAGMLTRRFGVRNLLLFCFLAAPAFGVLRAIYVRGPASAILAFLAGVVMCIWTVCFLPLTASLTSERNRAAATGLIFSVGIGATACGAAASGYLADWISRVGTALGPADVKRFVLLLSCGLAACGTVPLLHLRPLSTLTARPLALRQDFALLRHSFLRRFLPTMALWSGLLGAFTPFAAVYFIRERHVSLSHSGIIFSAAQFAQLIGGLAIPFVERSLGMAKGILAFQLATAVLFSLTALAVNPAWCIALFCGYSAAHWICSPSLYTLLMNNLAEPDRAAASALTMFSSSLFTAAASSALGILLVRFGYISVMLAMAALECVLAGLFWRTITARPFSPATEPHLCAQSVTD